jgi:hypothetical protein
MSTYLLTFVGPVTQARVELQALLKRFPKAFFVEKSKSEYEVSADFSFSQQISGYTQWRVQPIRVAA